jgi:hypothetical protein
MRFDVETQDLKAGGAQQASLSERVAEATAPCFGQRTFVGEVIEPPSSIMPV